MHQAISSVSYRKGLESDQCERISVKNLKKVVEDSENKEMGEEEDRSTVTLNKISSENEDAHEELKSCF